VPKPVTVLGKKMVALLGMICPNKTAVDKSSFVSVLIVAGRFGRPIVLNERFGLTKDAEPLSNDVNTNPVENGLLFDTSYAKILRKAIESVSYVFLELLLIYFGK
jgi:hypothetical protein